MASQVSENLTLINGGGGGDEEFKEMELLKMNNALIMSLMDESQGDESDDDHRLETLIRSLEAEITTEGRENSSSSTMEYELASNINGEDNQSWNVGQMDGHDYLPSPCDFMMEWVDMELVPSAPFDDRNWCVDPFGNSMDVTTELFDFSVIV